MATASSPLLIHPLPIHRRPSSAAVCSLSDYSSRPLLSRRHCIRLALSSPAIFLGAPAMADNIPLFGLRKRLKTIEEEAEEVLKEGEKAVEEGIAVAEKEVEVAAEGIESAAGIRIAGDLAQAGAVAGVEVVGVLVCVSVVNGILGPEAGKP